MLVVETIVALVIPIFVGMILYVLSTRNELVFIRRCVERSDRLTDIEERLSDVLEKIGVDAYVVVVKGFTDVFVATKLSDSYIIAGMTSSNDFKTLVRKALYSYCVAAIPKWVKAGVYVLPFSIAGVVGYFINFDDMIKDTAVFLSVLVSLMLVYSLSLKYFLMKRCKQLESRWKNAAC